VNALGSRLARLLLWDFDRGTLAYDLLWIVMVLFLALVPPAWLGDPLVVRR
jgi:hypothetical protein